MRLCYPASDDPAGRKSTGQVDVWLCSSGVTIGPHDFGPDLIQIELNFNRAVKA